MRGKLPSYLTCLSLNRITPAGAGKTKVHDRHAARPRDHPRRCGENRHLQQPPSRRLGSPPQVRGKLSPSPYTVAVSRITPAGAGKTIQLAENPGAVEDHPRRCGENRLFCGLFALKLGSPPQVRGKLCRLCGAKTARRITPAGAGKTDEGQAGHNGAEDHPRRCGENSPTQRAMELGLGSPPQVRGKLGGREHSGFKRGITPAGAGKTLKRSFRNQPFCSRAVQISFNFSNSLNVSLQSGSAR